MARVFISSILLFFSSAVTGYHSYAQPKWRYTGQVNVGGNLVLVRGPAQKFPGLKLFAGCSASALHGDLLLSYGPTLSIYTKTLGANLNPLVGDWQIDLNNSLTIGGAWGKALPYVKFARTMHNGESYNLVHSRDVAAFFSTNFILNNHRRHQAVGSINVTAGPVSFNYYNDGSPFHKIGLGDNFDRYWTGGGTITVHSKKNYNYAELSYDQFTGYVPLLYELTGILGINIPLYDTPGENKGYNFNTSAYHLRGNVDGRFAVHAGVMGSLKSSGPKNKFWGIQDIIHLKGNYPFHPNNDGNRFFFGGSYQQYEPFKL
jgi:hypothetical protein